MALWQLLPGAIALQLGVAASQLASASSLQPGSEHSRAADPPLLPASSAGTTIRGLLDVTLPPFSVDNSGKTDVTTALQAAIRHAHSSFLAVYLPHGEYLVSETLSAWENDTLPGYPRNVNNTWPCRFQPNVMLGARSMPQDGRLVRPRIVLKPHSPSFSTPGQPGKSRPVLDFTANNDPESATASVSGINFNQLFKGIDVTIGEGNPGASGVQLPGAQGSSVQDTTITVGSGFAGISGGSGAGGSHEMVTVIGGQVGLDFTVSLNCPTITGATLLNQTRAAIVYDGLEAASAVGLTVRLAPSSTASVLEVTSGPQSQWGEFSFVDSIFDMGGSKPTSCAVVRSNRSLYMRNVFVRGCDTLVAGEGSSQPPVKLQSAAGWSQVHEMVAGRPIPNGGDCKPLTMSVFKGGKKMPAVALNASSGVAEPAAAVTMQHDWDEATFPTLDQSGVVSVLSTGAVGDGVTDDTAAIQRALDTPGAVVLLPKGFYRISRPLEIKAGGATTLMGVDRSISVLMAASDGLGTTEAPLPILNVTNPDERIILTLFTIVTWEHLDNTYVLTWSNHNPRSVYRQNYFYRITECLYGFPHPIPVPRNRPTMPCRPSAQLAHPLNVIRGSISAYNYENEDFLYEAPGYRHMLVEGNRPTDSVRFYQANFEHASSEANMEVRDAFNVDIYSFKSEGEWSDLIAHGGRHSPCVCVWVRNSSRVHVYSHGGNARPPKTGSDYPAGFAQFPPSLYRVTNGSTDVILTNLVDQFQFPPESEWNMVFDDESGLTPQCDRPALWKS